VARKDAESAETADCLIIVTVARKDAESAEVADCLNHIGSIVSIVQLIGTNYTNYFEVTEALIFMLRIDYTK
jgi:hypothetical protein